MAPKRKLSDYAPDVSEELANKHLAKKTKVYLQSSLII